MCLDHQPLHHELLDVERAHGATSECCASPDLHIRPNLAQPANSAHREFPPVHPNSVDRLRNRVQPYDCSWRGSGPTLEVAIIVGPVAVTCTSAARAARVATVPSTPDVNEVRTAPRAHPGVLGVIEADGPESGTI